MLFRDFFHVNLLKGDGANCRDEMIKRVKIDLYKSFGDPKNDEAAAEVEELWRLNLCRLIEFKYSINFLHFLFPEQAGACDGSV